MDIRALRPKLQDIGRMEPSAPRTRKLARPAGVPKVLSQMRRDQRAKKGQRPPSAPDEQYEIKTKAMAQHASMISRPETRGRLFNMLGMLRYKSKRPKKKSLVQAWKGLPPETRLIFLGFMAGTLDLLFLPISVSPFASRGKRGGIDD